MSDIILASGSPRRAEILTNLGYEFIVILPTCDESGVDHLPPDQQVLSLAERKAGCVAQLHPDKIVIGSDTLVYGEGQVLGKPRDKADAIRMLALLSGKTHQVYTGLCVCYQGKKISLTSCAEVDFHPMTQEEIDWYVQSGEPMDKAGAYAIQGLGSRFIRGIRGDFFTIMGLPAHLVYKTVEEIKKMAR